MNQILERIINTISPAPECRPWLLLASGKSISIQASIHHYCIPKDNVGPYTHVEVGTFTQIPRFRIIPQDKISDNGLIVHGHVPVSTLNKYIEIDEGGFWDEH